MSENTGYSAKSKESYVNDSKKISDTDAIYFVDIEGPKYQKLEDMLPGKNYLADLGAPKYALPVPEGYSGQKSSQKGGKGTYIEMTQSFDSPFNREDSKFNLCEVCKAPIPKTARRCIFCATSKGGYRC